MGEDEGEGEGEGEGEAEAEAEAETDRGRTSEAARSSRLTLTHTHTHTFGPRGFLVGSFLLNTPLGLLLGWLQGTPSGGVCSLLLAARALCGLLLASFWRASRASRMLSSSLVSCSEKRTRGAALCGLMCVRGRRLRSVCGFMAHAAGTGTHTRVEDVPAACMPQGAINRELFRRLDSV